MTRIHLVATLFTCAALLGCAQNPPVTTGVRADCRTPVCHVKLDLSCSASGCTGSADNDPYHIHGPGRMIVWMLVSNDYRFCPQLGDGVFFQQPNGQFDLPLATDDPNGASSGSGPGYRNYKWTDANSVKDEQFKYRVIFHDQACTGPAHTWDPVIINDM